MVNGVADIAQRKEYAGTPLLPALPLVKHIPRWTNDFHSAHPRSNIEAQKVHQRVWPMQRHDNPVVPVSSSPPLSPQLDSACCSSWAFDAVVDYETTAFYIEGDTIDLCGGHATPDGVYHYHSTAG